MSAWGNGNFEQDGALDFVAEVQQPLIQKVRLVVEKPVLAEADEPDSGPIVAAVEILALLSEHANAVPPKPEEIRLWKAAFLSSWDRTAADVYASSTDVVERRSIISSTFDRLASVSDRFHSRTSNTE